MHEIYEKLKQRVRGAMEWLDDPTRTREEIEAWYPRYKAMFDEVTRLERRLHLENVRTKIPRGSDIHIKNIE